jgi:TolB-like protein/DNA-binding winged helix-turn-helix (wHTH) protein/Tfp pilus assembly protein PilF
MPDRSQRTLLRFESFELDTSSNELRKAGSLVKLQSQPFQLLVLLAERRGEVITREEIRQALWDNQTFVDFDRSINFCINQIRTALDDDPQSPRFIETLPRKGYRFIAAPAPSEETPKLAPETRRFQPRWWLLAGVGSAVAAIMLLGSNAGGLRDRILGQPGFKPIQSLAVLPLANLSHDPEQEYFAEGMTDELITALAKISPLRVVSRTSVTHYRGTNKTVGEIARELNVDAVLEGTVLRDHGRVRITAQLIRASPEGHLWAEKYEGSLEEVLKLQDAVAEAVAHSIRANLTPGQLALPAPRAINGEAYEAYLKGRYRQARFGEEDLQKSRKYFQEAIEKDPGYASAWSGLARSSTILAAYGVLPRAQTYPQAKAAAEKALQLDSSLAEPLVTLARLKTEYEWDWEGAEKLFRRAIDLSPNYGSAHQSYAVYLAAVGRPQEALAEAKRAREVEPMTHMFSTNVAWFYYLGHQYDQAERGCRISIEEDPTTSWSHICLGSVYLQTARPQQAIAELRQAIGLQRGRMELMYLGHALGVSGDRAEAQKVLEEMRDLSYREYVPPEYIAVVYEGLGDKDQAFQWFDKAVKERSMQSWVYPDVRQDPIRSDPRFKDLMQRMGLPH